MKGILTACLLLILNTITKGQEIPVPENFTIIDTITGDLDKDGIPELVAAYNTQEEKEDSYESIPRELIIYKIVDEQWTVWKKSNQALYGSRDGGMMGDPFGDIVIINGILHVSQNGGSSWKWGHTYKYRYQDGELYLIGYTSLSGKVCEHWQKVDFNLSTGKMIVTKEYEDCETSEQEVYKRENETFFKKGFRITMQNRTEKEIKIVTPKYNHEIYL